jgi:hypothetical protein
MKRTVDYRNQREHYDVRVTVTRLSDGETITFEPVNRWAAWRLTSQRMLDRIFKGGA